MKSKYIFFLTIVLVACLFSVGCQNLTTTEVPTLLLPTETPVTPSPVSPTATKTHTPTAQPTKDPRIVSREKLNCTLLENFTKCIDETIGIEFEYPTSWGEIEGVLRTGGDSGYAYKYLFNGGTVPEIYLPQTGGVSIDFAEGREWNPLDFGGFGDKPYQVDSCEQRDYYPICNEVNSDVKWMIRFPNAKYLCENAHFYISKNFRIEVNLPNSNNVNGFVLETVFLSQNLLDEVSRDIYSTFLVETEEISFPKSCDTASQQAFDELITKFIERLQTKSLDTETQNNLDNLIHVAESITLK